MKATERNVRPHLACHLCMIFYCLFRRHMNKHASRPEVFTLDYEVSHTPIPITVHCTDGFEACSNAKKLVRQNELPRLTSVVFVLYLANGMGFSPVVVYTLPGKFLQILNIQPGKPNIYPG